MKIGDKVRNTIWDKEGEIIEEHENYWAIIDQEGTFLTMTPEEWLQQQLIPFSKEEVSKQKWFTVKMSNGGTFWCCHGKLDLMQ